MGTNRDGDIRVVMQDIAFISLNTQLMLDITIKNPPRHDTLPFQPRFQSARRPSRFVRGECYGLLQRSTDSGA